MHIDPEQLEKYALGHLSEAENAALEEHLLICSQCQDDLALTDRSIAAIRDVLKRHPPEQLS